MCPLLAAGLPSAEMSDYHTLCSVFRRSVSLVTFYPH
jgi:hypothetical protein